MLCGVSLKQQKRIRSVAMDAGSVQTKHKKPTQRLKHDMHVHPSFNIPLYNVPYFISHHDP